MAQDIGIRTKKNEDTAQWYEQVVLQSGIAEFGPVKGTIIIRPKGFYIWQKIQERFNKFMNQFGVDQCYFPLFIPKSYFEREAKHAQGFAPELAWVASEQSTDGDEKAIIRPTSETVIVDAFSRWLRSYKQLPLKVNQWCNIVRWEVKQTKLFLRGREFLWQEGHCLYETQEQAQTEVITVLREYEQLCKDTLALPMIVGEKSIAERFAGGLRTYAIQGIMPDGKGLQCGTTHLLSQGFMEQFDVTYSGRDEKKQHPHYTSWGISTRLIGAAIMVHSDDKGLVLPPKISKQQVIIIPITKKEISEEFKQYVAKVAQLTNATIDERKEYSFGFKMNECELQGIPLLILIGEKEMQEQKVTLKFRDMDTKIQVAIDQVSQAVQSGLEQMHNRLYDKAKEQMNKQIVRVHTIEEFAQKITENCIVVAPFFDDPTVEDSIYEHYAVKTQCIDLQPIPETQCIFSKKPTTKLAYFGKNY
jgi:prolyl-tRNA synthetase